MAQQGVGLLLRRLCITSRTQSFGTSAVRFQDTVGFIGLGNMGSHMARNLIKKGYPLIVYDAVPAAVETLIKDGATALNSARAVADKASTLVTMLPSSPHVQEVYSGEDGIFRSVQRGSLLIDCSTVDPNTSQQQATRASELGATFMDAPVSGGVLAARDATLTFMVGGDERRFAEAEKVLSCMGKNVVHCGDVGMGEAAKICNNMLLAISMIGVSETMNLGIRLGLDSKMLARILNMSSGRCWSSDTYNPCPGVIDGVPSSRDYEGGFGTELMTKDLSLAQNAAINSKTSTPMGALALQLYRILSNSEHGTKDFSVMFKYLQQTRT